MLKRLLCILLCCIFVLLSSCGYTQEDLDLAYQDGYNDGFDAGYEKGYTAPKPVNMPLSGTILGGKAYNGASDSELTIETSDSAYVVSVKNGYGEEKVTFFVRPNSTVTVGVPATLLSVYFASGDTWYGYGEGLMFGEDTVYTKDDDVLNFHGYTYTYTLYSVYDGNFSETPSSQDEFF